MRTAKTIQRLALLLSATALALAALAPTAFADDSAAIDGFAIASFDGDVAANPAGDPFTQAGGTPDSVGTKFTLSTYDNPDTCSFCNPWPEEPLRNIFADVPPGLVGNVSGIPQCKAEELAAPLEINPLGTLCPSASQVGRIRVATNAGLFLPYKPVFVMVPPPGVAARLGFIVFGTVVVLDAKLRNDGDYGITVASRYTSEGLPIVGTTLRLWGVPAADSHDAERACPGQEEPHTGPPADPGPPGHPACDSTAAKKPFLRLPTSCTKAGEGLTTAAHADSYYHPGAFKEDGTPDLSDPNWKSAAFESHLPPGLLSDPAEPDPGLWGAPQGPTGCLEVPVKGSLEAQTTSIDAETPSGLEVHVEVPNPGLESATGISSSDFKAVKVTLPQGVTVNPSQAEGLGVCSPGQYESSELSFYGTGPGCPTDSKIGSVSVKSPLLDETIPGEVFVAAPHDNPFDSLLALYVVLKEPQRGILVKLAGKVTTDERTGQIVTSFENLPQVPFSTFDFRFREGARAPLVTPQACGTYTTQAVMTPWSDPAHPITRTSSFEIVRGIGGSPCPSGGLPPFKPGLVAGSLNNNAGSYSPFNIRLFRNDGEQEFTNFSIKLPPGLTGKLAGIPFCPDAAIAAAKSRTGAQELAAPACPKASEVGRTLAGAGVGSVLTYAPGKIYLAGPYNGSALSIAAITAAKVGPFDLGTVVVRQALKINPETAEVFIDATGSDPIPHIIKGITVHLRDIRAYVDKPQFTLNPTSCDATSTASTVLGSGLDFASLADDRPVTVTSRYQAANCANLGFKPKLALSLSGGTRRGDNPTFKAVLRARKGDANIGAAQVTLPHSAFLDNEHIKTICTRVQFKEGTVPGERCPKASIYGYAKAITPLLDEPLQGPVFLRSSSHRLPDLIAALHSGKIDINLAGRIDSVEGGRIRNTFEAVPDAPVTKFTLTMQGAKKGLLVNSVNLCKQTNRALSHFVGQNGKVYDTKPVVKASGCKQARKAKKHDKR